VSNAYQVWSRMNLNELQSFLSPSEVRHQKKVKSFETSTENNKEHVEASNPTQVTNAKLLLKVVSIESPKLLLMRMMNVMRLILELSMRFEISPYCKVRH